MHMDIIPMHFWHIIMAVLRRFMLLSSSLYLLMLGASYRFRRQMSTLFAYFGVFSKKVPDISKRFRAICHDANSSCTNHKMVYNGTV